MWIEDILLGLLPIALLALIPLVVAFLIRGVLSVVLTKIPSFVKVYIMCVFILMGLSLFMTSPGNHATSEASGIISILRDMQQAAQLFYLDNQDTLSEIPRGSNIAEYLKQHRNTTFELSNDGPFIFIISGEHWWVGYSFDRNRRATRDIRRRLVFRASDVGLLGTSESAPPVSVHAAYRYNMDDFVWMFVREVTEVAE